MSAPPPNNLPNGQAPNNSNAPSAPKRPPTYRRARAANPLVARGKNDPSKMMNRPASTQRPSATVAVMPGIPKDPAEALREKDAERLRKFEMERRANDGWTDPPPASGEYTDFPLVISKKALEKMRFHVMRFSNPKGTTDGRSIDPTDPNEFTRPVTLHRRDPRQPAPGREVKEEDVAMEEPPVEEPADDKEAERLAQLKADREAQRAIDMAQIAPSAAKPNEPVPKKQPQKKEKPFNSHRQTKKDYDPKSSGLRYEEALPWHVEDADGKNVWVGSYVAALSQANAGLVISGDGFRMIPLEKYYKFTAKPRFKAFSIEQAENIMKQKVDIGHHKMSEEAKQQQREIEATREFLRGSNKTKVKQESHTYKSAPKSEKMDADDVEFSADEFQDDDETQGIEPERDEDAKESKERQRRNQLGANLFGDANENAVEKEEAEEELLELLRKSEGKKVRKALARREKHLEYQSDSDENPYASSSSSDSESDAENKEDKDKDKDKEQKDKEAKDKASGAAPKGSTTPSGGKKHGKSLKRPGSPTLSESSGNESTRKKAKKNAAGSVQPSRSTTPLPGQRPNKRAGDGETAAGDMSDGGLKKKRVKLGATGSGAKGTPAGSRAGSPNPGQPGAGSGSTPASPAKTPVLSVSAEDVKAALAENPQGIGIGDLLKKYFNDRVGGDNKQLRKEFIGLVTKHALFDKTDKLLRPKPNK